MNELRLFLINVVRGFVGVISLIYIIGIFIWIIGKSFYQSNVPIYIHDPWVGVVSVFCWGVLSLYKKKVEG